MVINELIVMQIGYLSKIKPVVINERLVLKMVGSKLSILLSLFSKPNLCFKDQCCCLTLKETCCPSEAQSSSQCTAQCWSRRCLWWHPAGPGRWRWRRRRGILGCWWSSFLFVCYMSPVLQPGASVYIDWPPWLATVRSGISRYSINVCPIIFQNSYCSHLYAFQ